MPYLRPADAASVTGAPLADGLLSIAAGWSAQWGEGVQLVGAGLSTEPDPQAVVLGSRDVPDMLDLAARTQPGPFLPRTRELGTYLGIRHGGRLVRWPVNGCTRGAGPRSAPSVPTPPCAGEQIPHERRANN